MRARHNELLSFGDPACGSVSRSAFKRPGSPLFERIQDDECGIWTTLEKPKHETETEALSIYVHDGAISRGTFVKKNKSFLHLHLFYLLRIDCRISFSSYLLRMNPAKESFIPIIGNRYWTLSRDNRFVPEFEITSHFPSFVNSQNMHVYFLW